MEDILAVIERELSFNTSPEEIKKQLLEKGYLENDIDVALHQSARNRGEDPRKLVRSITIKEVFDIYVRYDIIKEDLARPVRSR